MEKNFHPCSSRGASSTWGFTLLELMVASAVFLIILGMLAGVVSSVSSVSSQASLRMEVSRLGREVFDSIQQDLAQMPQAPTYIGTNAPSRLLVNPPTLDSRFNNGCSIFWPASVARDRSLGDVAILGYFVQRFGTTNAQLRRVFLEPGNETEYFLHSSQTWMNTAIAERFEGSKPEMSPNDRGWFADGVLAIWVRCFDAEGNIISTAGDGTVTGYRFDSSSGFRTGSGASERRYETIHALPSVIEVGLLCVSPREIAKISSLPAPTVSNPANFDADMNATLAAFRGQNRNITTATLLTRRFFLKGGQP